VVPGRQRPDQCSCRPCRAAPAAGIATPPITMEAVPMTKVVADAIALVGQVVPRDVGSPSSVAGDSAPIDVSKPAVDAATHAGPTSAGCNAGSDSRANAGPDAGSVARPGRPIGTGAGSASADVADVSSAAPDRSVANRSAAGRRQCRGSIADPAAD